MALSDRKLTAGGEAHFSVEKALFMRGGAVFPVSYRDSGGGLLRQHQSGVRPVWLYWSREMERLPRISCRAPNIAPEEEGGG